jgi:hypothetical protein
MAHRIPERRRYRGDLNAISVLCDQEPHSNSRWLAASLAQPNQGELDAYLWTLSPATLRL